MRTLLWIVVTVLFFVFSCTKIDTTPIGSGLIPPIDGVTTLDTALSIVTGNFINPAQDSSKVGKYDDHVIGVINNDPLFGKTIAQAFFELKPPSYKFYLPGGTSLTPDSVVLILHYKGSYGDTLINQNWEVRELAETMQRDSSYPVSTQFATGNVLGSKNINITTLNDSVFNDFETGDDQVRIKLSSDFANRLISQYDSTEGNAYQSDSLFRDHFKGFAVGPAAGSTGNGLVRVNLSDTGTKLALFYKYKNVDSPNMSSGVSYFRFNTTVAAVSGNANYIKRDYTGSPLQTSLSDPAKNDSVLYIQTFPGTYATIKIPELSGFDNSVIHRAELSVYQVPDALSQSEIFTPPQYLLLSSYDSSIARQINVPNDFIVSTSSVANISSFGGYTSQKIVSGYGPVNAYVFDLSRYVQGIVTRHDKNLTLKLSAPSNDSLTYTAPYPVTAPSVTPFYLTPSNANNVAIGRVALAGGGMSANSLLRMRLRIIYSKL